MLTLRPYQLDAVAAVQKAALAGHQRVLISLPTGTGKTVVFSEIIRRRGGRALVLAHRDELIGQAAAKVREVWPEAKPGIVKAESDAVDADVVVASVQTLARPARLARLIAAGAFQTVIVDEAHHAVADGYRAVLEAVGGFRSGGPLVVGVTATAFRADGESLGDVFEHVVFEAGILPMIGSGYLCDVRAKRIRLDADFGFHVRSGDYAVNEVEEELLRANAPEHAAAAYLEHAAGRRALVFTPTVAVAQAMAEAFRAAGVPAEALDGTTPPDKRRGILARLKSGKTLAVPNCAVLTEGFDEPSISCVIVARPTRSKGLYCQMVGRGTRPHPCKNDLLILDLVGVTSRLDLMTAAKLFDVPERRLATDCTVTEAVAAEAEEQARVAGRRVAEDVDPFRARRFRWVATPSGAYSLSLVDGTLLLVPEHAGRYRVVQSNRDRSSVVLASGLSLPYAQGFAEDRMRAAGAAVLNDRGAAWRSGPASPKQEARLRRWRRWRPGMTKGEASDAISAYVSARVARTASPAEVSA